MVKVQGMGQFKDRIKTIRKNVTKNVAQLEDKTLDVGLKHAKRNVPVESGELRDSIVKVKGGLVVNAEHGEEVEYGTFKMPAQPYIRPAVVEMEKYLKEHAGGVLDDTK